MKKLLILLITLFMISCSNEPITTDIITADAKANLQKGKPAKCDAPVFDLSVPVEALARETIVKQFLGTNCATYYGTEYCGQVYVRQYYWDDTIIQIMYLLDNIEYLQVGDEVQTFPYYKVVYRFRVKDSNGIVVIEDCVYPRSYPTDYQIPQKIKNLDFVNETYTMEFIDFPEVSPFTILTYN